MRRNEACLNKLLLLTAIPGTQWAMFGEDPFIVGGAESVPFSARKFISMDICREITRKSSPTAL